MGVAVETAAASSGVLSAASAPVVASASANVTSAEDYCRGVRAAQPQPLGNVRAAAAAGGKGTLELVRGPVMAVVLILVYVLVSGKLRARK
jgi:hypothetical protein